MRFDPKGRLIFVRAQVEGPSGGYDPWLALDTGATRTVLAEHVLRSIGFDPGTLPRPHRAAAAGGNLPAGMVSVARLSALGVTRLRQDVMFHYLNPSTRVEGVLGLDFFRGHVLTLDFARGRITLRPPRPWWRFWG